MKRKKSYRRRKFTTSTFFVEGQLCKIFFQPLSTFNKNHVVWNVGFAIGKSKRQLNDWYWKRKNKRSTSIRNKMIGKSGLKTIKKGFYEVLKLRWIVEPGDVIFLDCTSGDPERQFKAWSRWHKYHPEWTIDYENKIFFWHRPPQSNDPIWQTHKIIGKNPVNPLLNTENSRYFECFSALPKDQHTARSKHQN